MAILKMNGANTSPCRIPVAVSNGLVSSLSQQTKKQKQKNTVTHHRGLLMASTIAWDAIMAKDGKQRL